VVIVGASIAFGAMTQRRVGGLVFLGLLLLAAFALAAITPVSVGAGVGEKSEQPTTVTALDASYEHGIGELDLDLSAVTLPAGTTSVDASVGIGKLVVTVPADIAVVIDAHAGIGSIDLLGAQDDGVDADRILTLPGATQDAPVLDLEADIAIGDIEVRRG
jgi:predicted membrane protein